MLLPVGSSRRASWSRIAAPVVWLAATAAVAGCRAPSPPPVPQTTEHSLAGLAAQHIVILPTYLVRTAPGLNWTIGRPTELARTLDADILEAFDDRGLRKTWIFPPDLEESYRHNPNYATDPHALAEEPLRSPQLASEARLPEPLASEVRTMVALHDDARYVLAPVELMLEPVASGGGRGVLRVVLIDARLSQVMWIGDVPGDVAPSFGPVITASVAAALANAVAP